MLFGTTSPSEKRKAFRQALASGSLLRFPGAFSPLVAMQIEKLGFEGIYISGAVLANDLGYPDIGLTTLSEVAGRGRQIARVTKLPSIIDIDTGFGEPLNVTRSVQELIELGIAGCHLEDQMNPKRCGHLDNKALVSSEEMLKKVKAASNAKTLDPNFLIIARTDARASEGLDKAIDRAKAYVDAGAEMIFPEALQDEKEFEKFRKEVKVPLLANMTEFGKSKLLTTQQLSNLGFNLVIYPVTSLRLAMKAVETGLQEIKAKGTQESVLDKMQHRKELYELVRYEEYNQFDQSIFNFKV
jgi:methylisocitrate lyase